MLESIERVVRRLAQARPLADVHFDCLLQEEFRKHSEQHFTPIEVALRAAQHLTNGKPAQILDVGSGVGKFCLVGALATEGLFTGAERRASLVEEANRMKHLLEVQRANFLQADALELDWAQFDGAYLFNPFLEHLVSQIRLDHSVDFSEALFEKSFRTVQAQLRKVRLGFRVALYHGMGGGIPVGFRRLVKEPMGTGFLEVWEKRQESQTESVPFG